MIKNEDSCAVYGFIIVFLQLVNHEMNMKRLFLHLLVLLSIPAMAQEKDHNFDVAKNLDVLNVIYKHLDMMYVDTLDANEVIGNGIRAMLRSLDPYTVYYTSDDMKDLRELRTGTYAGVGSVIRKNLKLNRVIISEPYEGMPAAEAGLKRGDVILAIDDEDMREKDVSYVSDHLRGDAGTSFMIKVLRPSTGKTMKMKLTRRAIQMPAVPFYGMRPDGVGYINLNSFTEGSARDVRRAVLELRRQGMRGLVFDLRGNGGGSEQEAVNIVNMFVPKGQLIVSNRSKLQQMNRDYKTTVEPIDSVMPLVVLVDDDTASASEITSGALQDLDRAVILGTRTYGKGLVQVTTDLPYNGSLKLTTSKYYIPSGRCIQAINYKHARGGYVEHVPDSLTRVFYTQGGREVRDGGGIKPDVEIKADSMTNLVANLVYLDSAEVMLNYELDYVAKHPTIGPAATFKLTDADYEEFKQRVLKSNFKYDRSTETYLDNLEKLARFEGYYDDARTDFENLRAKLKHNVEKDLDYNKETLMQLLANNIVHNYYYQRGTIENSFLWDKQLQEAERLIKTPEEYEKILRPGNN